MNIGIIGLGLIGGSLGKALHGKHTVYGYDTDTNVMLKASLTDAIDNYLTDDNYKLLDVLFIATYPRSFQTIIANVGNKLQAGAIIMDISGIKRTVVRYMEAAKLNFPHLNFIATHPMAGREYSGIEHSSVNLFNNASLLMVNVHSDMAALTTAKELFLEIGFERVVVTTAEEHDKIIAFTSQLAHIISSSYIKSETADMHYGFSAGSFRDLTRVARLNPTMWTELFIDNSDNLITELNSLIYHLTEYKLALENKEEKVLYQLLDEGNKRKLYIDEKTRNWKKSE